MKYTKIVRNKQLKVKSVILPLVPSSRLYRYRCYRGTNVTASDELNNKLTFPRKLGSHRLLVISHTLTILAACHLLLATLATLAPLAHLLTSNIVYLRSTRPPLGHEAVNNFIIYLSRGCRYLLYVLLARQVFRFITHRTKKGNDWRSVTCREICF